MKRIWAYLNFIVLLLASPSMLRNPVIFCFIWLPWLCLGALWLISSRKHEKTIQSTKEEKQSFCYKIILLLLRIIYVPFMLFLYVGMIFLPFETGVNKETVLYALCAFLIIFLTNFSLYLGKEKLKIVMVILTYFLPFGFFYLLLCNDMHHSDGLHSGLSALALIIGGVSLSFVHSFLLALGEYLFLEQKK